MFKNKQTNKQTNKENRAIKLSLCEKENLCKRIVYAVYQMLYANILLLTDLFCVSFRLGRNTQLPHKIRELLGGACTFSSRCGQWNVCLGKAYWELQ